MALTFRRGVDSSTADAKRKILLYGPSGVGKTWLASSGGAGVVVLLTEKNGEQAVRCSNPLARYAVCTSAADLRDFIVAASSGALSDPANPVDTIVIDGLTEVQQLFKDELLAKLVEEVNEGGGKRVTSNDVTMTLEMWGALSNKMRLFLRALRNLDCNVVATALEEVETIGERQAVYPAFQGRKLYSEVMQYFDLVGHVEKVTRGDVTKHFAVFDAAKGVAAKPQHPIRGRREGPVPDWLTELRVAADSHALQGRTATVPAVVGDPADAPAASAAPVAAPAQPASPGAARRRFAHRAPAAAEQATEHNNQQGGATAEESGA